MPSPETNSGSEQPFTPVRSENNGVQTVAHHAPASSSDKHSQSKMGCFLIKWHFLSFKSTNLSEGDRAEGGGQAEVAGRGIIKSITLQVSGLGHHPAEVQMPTMTMTWKTGLLQSLIHLRPGAAEDQTTSSATRQHVNSWQHGF